MGLILEHQLWAPAALLQTSCLCPSFHPPKNTLLLSLRKIPETQTHTRARVHTLGTVGPLRGNFSQLKLSVVTDDTAKTQEVTLSLNLCIYVRNVV